jgi:hypothetical protein
MSANLDLVCSILAAWGRSDMRWTEWAAPDIEYVNADGPAPGSGHGLPGMAKVVRDWLNAWRGGEWRPRSTASSIASAFSPS